MENIGTTTVELTGGEPLMHPDFKKILSLSLQKFKKVNLLSNGVLFDDEIFEIIENNKQKMYFQISIDGATESSNRSIRGIRNTWKKTLTTLKRLQNLDCHYRVPFMVTKQNTHEMELICNLFAKENLHNLIFSQVTQLGRACDSRNCGFSELESSYIYDNSKDLYIKYPDLFYKLPNDVDGIRINNGCGAGWQQMAISSSGSVDACLLFDGHGNIGNINEEDFLDICNSEKVRFYTHFTIDPNNNKCSVCKYHNYCGTCLVRIYAANVKRIRESEGLCEIVLQNGMSDLFNFDSDFKFNI